MRLSVPRRKFAIICTAVVLLNGNSRNALSADPTAKPPAEGPKWILNVQKGSIARLEAVPGNATRKRINIGARSNGPGWHIQAVVGTWPVEMGKKYVVQWSGRADKPRSVSFGASQSTPPFASVGLYRTVALTTEWKEYKFEFVATQKGEKIRLNFDLNTADSAVELGDVFLGSESDKPTPPPSPGSTPAPTVQTDKSPMSLPWRLWLGVGSAAEAIQTTTPETALRVAISRVAHSQPDDIVLAAPLGTIKKEIPCMVTLRLRADGNKKVNLAVVDSRKLETPIGLNETIDISREWKVIERQFKPSLDADTAMLQLGVGADDTDIEISQLKLTFPVPTPKK